MADAGPGVEPGPQRPEGRIHVKKIDNRPYMSTDELVQKKVMPKATYDKIKNQIVAK